MRTWYQSHMSCAPFQCPASYSYRKLIFVCSWSYVDIIKLITFSAEFIHVNVLYDRARPNLVTLPCSGTWQIDDVTIWLVLLRRLADWWWSCSPTCARGRLRTSDSSALGSTAGMAYRWGTRTPASIGSSRTSWSREETSWRYDLRFLDELLANSDVHHN